MQLLLNIPNSLQEYVEDCEDADRISAEIDAGIMPTYSLQEVKHHIGVDN